MIFEINTEHIEGLNDTDLRTLIAHLCEQEVRNAEQSTVGVTWGGHQNAPDGGIDVRVDLGSEVNISGYIPRPSTGIQVKASDMNRTAILNEMKPKGELLTSIQELGTRNGAYIIASSTSSLSDTSLTNRRNAMAEALVGVKATENLHVDFYDQRRLATWVNLYPGLVAWVLKQTGNALSGWCPFDDWSSSPTKIDAKYFADEKVRLLRTRISDDNSLGITDGINAMRSILAEPKGTIRLVGLSGVGKTRLAQALFDDRIGENTLDKTLVIYTDISNAPDPIPIDLLSVLVAKNQRAILIIDNCGIDLHKKLVTRINQTRGLVSLLTIEYDIRDDEPDNTDVFKLEAVTEELIEEILENRFPALSEPDRRKIAEFSNGNARIAFALANTTENGESIANMHDSELFTRLFYQNKGIDSNLLNAAKACSLLYSYDGETLDGDDAELPALAALAGQTIQELYRHSSELFRRQLVQKRSKWRAVLPHALAHYLAKLALEDIPFESIKANIVNGGSARLLKSFSRRIGYLHDTEQASAIAKDWLSEGGLLGQANSLNKLGEDLLRNIAPIDIELTLSYFEKRVNQGNQFFTTENTNRSTIIGILRSLAYDADLFERSITLLIGFGRHEEAQNNNSQTARNILESLFCIYLSGTHASAVQRIKVIRTLLESNDKHDHEMGLSALSAMLETDHFSSHYRFEFGARSRNFGLHPNSSEAISEWFSAVLTLVAEFGTNDHPQSAKIREKFAGKMRWLCRHPLLIDKTIATAGELSCEGGWPLGWVGVRSAIKARRKGMPDEELQKLKALADRLIPKNLCDMIRSYVLTKEWGMLDIADLDEDEELKPMEAREKIHDICKDLGRQLAKSPKELDKLLPEILSSDTNKSWSLGKGLAEGAESLELLWGEIINTKFADNESYNNAGLMAGFLAAASNIDLEVVESLLDATLNDKKLHASFVYLQINASITDRGIKRLKNAVKIESVPVYSFKNLSYGRVTDQIQDSDLADLLEKITNRHEGLVVAIDIFSMVIHGINADKKNVTQKQKQIGQTLLSKLTLIGRSDQQDYNLAQIAQACLGDQSSEPVATSICEKFLAGIRNHDVYAWRFNQFVSALALTHPIVVLDILVGQTSNEYPSSRDMFRELREDRTCPIENIPDAVLLDWAKANTAKRFHQLAQVVRYSTQADKNVPRKWTTTAHKLIHHAPDPVAILRIFAGRFMPMSWSGSRADLMQQRVPLLESLRDHEKSEISEWAITKLQEHTDLIAKVREDEVQRHREQDEAFE